MRYSGSFEKIHTMSQDIALRSTIKYRRVAVYLGRIFMAEVQRGPVQGWAIPLKGKKDIILGLVCGLTDYEWKIISGYMEELIQRAVDNGTGSGINQSRTTLRRGWIRDLDMVRAFS